MVRSVAVWLFVAALGCGDDDNVGTGGTGGAMEVTQGTGAVGPGTGGVVPVADEDAGTTVDAGTDTISENFDNGIPQDGGVLSTCFGDDGCKGDLECHGDLGAAPPLLPTARVGFCTETCEGDKDCVDIEGVLTLCSAGQCHVDCSASQSDGQCPASMECVNDDCAYGDDAAAVGGYWAKCAPEQNECGGDLVCTNQTVLGIIDNPLLQVDEMCTTQCAMDAECTVDGGAGGSPKCQVQGLNVVVGFCVIACMGDEQCPGAMVCPEGIDFCVNPGE